MAATNTSWRPGKSGNPRGRPAGVAARLKVLRDLTTDDVLARVWNALLEAAAGGDVAACRVVLDRVLGPTAHLAEVDSESQSTPDSMFRELIEAVKKREAHNES